MCVSIVCGFHILNVTCKKGGRQKSIAFNSKHVITNHFYSISCQLLLLEKKPSIPNSKVIHMKLFWIFSTCAILRLFTFTIRIFSELYQKFQGKEQKLKNCRCLHSSAHDCYACARVETVAEFISIPLKLSIQFYKKTA